MRTIDIHEAKARLFQLVEEAAQGEPFIIAKAGKPRVKVVRIDAPEGKAVRRIGFLKGKIAIPDDFDTMASNQIEKLFVGEEFTAQKHH